MPTHPEESASHEATSRRVFWGPVFVGALACFILQLVLALTGSVLGLAFVDDVPFEAIGIGVGVATAVGLFLQFFVGGYVAANLSPQPTRGARFVQGFTVWALVVVGFSVVLSRGLSSPLGLMLGAARITTLPLKDPDLSAQIRRLSPKIVSDIQLAKGKIVSRFETASPHQMAEAERRLFEEAAQEVRQATVRASLIALLALLWSGLAAFLGGGAGGRAAKPPRRQKSEIELGRAA